MKKRIFGRKAGSDEPMALLLESGGVSTGGRTVDPGVVDQFALANARRQVEMLREKNVEGYVVFENDTTAAKRKEIDSRPYEAVIGFGSEAAKPGL